MALHVALTHETIYRYDRQIGMGPQVIRLRPAPHSRTPILSYSMRIEPATHFINWQQDPYGNFLARVVLPEETDVFSVTVDLIADMAVINPFDFFVEESATEFPFTYDPELKKELGPYLDVAPAGPRLTKYLASIDRRSRPTNRFHHRHQSRSRAGDPLSDPHGARRADARGDADQRIRFLSRQRLADGADLSPPRARGAVRLRLPDPAHAGR